MASFPEHAEFPLLTPAMACLEQLVHPYLFNLDGKTPFRCEPLEDDRVSSGPDPQIGQRAGAAAQGNTRLKRS